MKKLIALVCLLAFAAGAAAEEGDAVLVFSSFGGDPVGYSLEIADPEIAAWSSAIQWDSDEDPLPPGTGYTETCTFRGLKPGETTLTVTSGERVEVYAVTVDADLRVTLSRPRALTRFDYYWHGSSRPRSWSIFLLEDQYCLSEDGNMPRRIDPAVAAELERIVEAYDMAAWDGFSGSNPNVLDGEGFSLELVFSDGATVTASGDNAFPEGYHDAMDAVMETLTRERMAWLSGTYCQEGGSAWIALNADGTFDLSTGVSGEWSEYYGALTLSGGGVRLTFFLDDGALAYCRDDSDLFPDGARFLREGTIGP